MDPPNPPTSTSTSTNMNMSHLSSAPPNPTSSSSWHISYHSKPSSEPIAYYCLAGRTFFSYITARRSLILGRSSTQAAGTNVPQDNNQSALSLGENKHISRSHLRIDWDSTAHQWRMTVMGKNGFWYGPDKYVPNDQSPSISSSSSSSGNVPSSSILLHRRRASQIRIGAGEDACIFYFMPALDEATTRKKATSTSTDVSKVSASVATPSIQPKKRKKPNEDSDVSQPSDGKKKRSKPNHTNAAIVVDLSTPTPPSSNNDNTQTLPSYP